MSISIQTNVNALMAQENLRSNTDFQSKTIERLTSGYRINSSGDDAAGLAVANKFRSDTAELTQGVRNANDGISTLQIIDGGANNISKILDRMKTLATQSASTAFTGNRTTLDNEFQALKGEIDRQASNVSLNTGGASNTLMSVYIGGGGSNQSNAKVTVDLSGTGNAIDSSGLGVSANSLLAGGSAADVNATMVLTGAGRLNLAGGTQQFTFQLGTTSVVATVDGGGSGITTDAAVTQLNVALNASGISAFIDSSTGGLDFSSASAYTLQMGAKSAGLGLVSDTGYSENTGLYRMGTAGFNGTFGAIATAGTTETLTFVINGVSKTAALDNATTGVSVPAALQYLNQQLAGTGIVALRDMNGGDGITFQSNAAFTMSSSHAGAGVTGVTSGNLALTAATPPVAGASATSNALTALTALTNAVTNLGSVQGKIGAGQNKLQYAVNLAQSQISGFSAAESRIRDTDVASEAANLTKAQVLVQASMAAMAQANSAPQAVLSLLRG
jgi:flagellin